MSEFVLGALFYEVGRFRKRILADGRGWLDHSLDTLSSNGLEAIAYKIRHSAADLENAARYSLGNLAKLPEEDGEPIPLESVFSRVSLGGTATTRYHLPLPLSAEPNFPVEHAGEKKSLEKQYGDLWCKFEADLVKSSGNLNANTALALLEKYCSFVPYNQVFPDISLYEQARMTAAIASCLNFKELKAEEFLLVGGDFSGVQDFIYTISSKGALKGLRGRSFFLELLAEHVIVELLQGLDLSRANILFNGGARFNLLLPNTGKALELLEGQRNSINEYFRLEHGARIYLVIAWEDMQYTDFSGQNLPALYKKLGRAISDDKKRKFVTNIEQIFTRAEQKKPASHPSDQKWTKDCPRCGRSRGDKVALDFDGYTVHGCRDCLPAEPEHGECQVCHKESYLIGLPYHHEELAEIESSGEITLACPFCSDMFHLGEHLFFDNHIIRCNDRPEEGKGIARIAGKWYALLPGKIPDKKSLDTSDAAWILNSLDEPAHFSASDKIHPFMLANYRPEGNDVKSKDLTFEWLAEQSVGAGRLGVLRLDVDNLGDIATGKGFAENEVSLLKLATVSRALTLFFKFYMNGICGTHFTLPRVSILPYTEPADRKMVIVYSGGDDAFVVGAWNDIIEFAFDINTAFKKYTGGNPDIHLSAGMLVREPHYPIYQFASEAAEAEVEAKRNRSNGHEKDSFAPFFKSQIFGTEDGRQALRWDVPGSKFSAKGMMDLAKELAEELQDKRAKGSFTLKPGGRALLYKLFSVAEAKKTRGKLYLPALAYALSRAEVSPALEKSLLDADTINYLHPAVTWVELLGRRKHTE